MGIVPPFKQGCKGSSIKQPVQLEQTLDAAVYKHVGRNALDGNLIFAL